jgi:hypothetical protein
MTYDFHLSGNLLGDLTQTTAFNVHEVFTLPNVHAEIAKAKLQLETLLTSILKIGKTAPMDVLIRDIQIRIHKIETELLEFGAIAAGFNDDFCFNPNRRNSS